MYVRKTQLGQLLQENGPWMRWPWPPVPQPAAPLPASAGEAGITDDIYSIYLSLSLSLSL